MAKTASRIDRNKICADLTIVISKDISGHFIFFFMKVYYFLYSVITIIRKEIEKYPKKGCLVQKIQCFFLKSRRKNSIVLSGFLQIIHFQMLLEEFYDNNNERKEKC